MVVSPESALPSLSVVVCAFTMDRWDQLVASIESIQQQSRNPQQILLVTDHNDALAAKAESFFEDVTVIRSRKPQGLSGARNTGVEAANGDVVAFLDDDARATPSWLDNLGRWYDDPAVVAVGGEIRPSWSRGEPAWFPREFLWVVGCTYKGMPERAAQVRNVIGANMSFRRSVLQELGGFNAELGRVGANQMGCEETEVCIKALQQNPRSMVMFDPEAVVFHSVLPGRERFSYFLRRCYAEGRSKYELRRLVGRDALSSEKTYLIRTIKETVIGGAGSAILKFDSASGLRALACLSGFAAAAAGYIQAVTRVR